LSPKRAAGSSEARQREGRPGALCLPAEERILHWQALSLV